MHCGLILQAFIYILYSSATQAADFKANNHELTWVDHLDRTDFVFTTELADTKDTYTGFGFSKDQLMGDSDIVICKTFGTESSIEHYYVEPGQKRPYPIDKENLSIGLENTKINYSNGKLECSFTRPKMVTAIGSEKHFDLNEPYYLFTAYGKLNASNIMVYHGAENRWSTENKISFSQNTYKKEGFDVHWKDNKDMTTFTFRTKLGSDNVWSAFALSDDKNMGKDDVIVCKSVNGILSVQHLYNEGRSAPVPINADDLQIGLTDIKINQENGYLKCSCNRQKSMPGNDKYFDVRNSTYYILNAHGETNGDSLSYHTSRVSSSEKYNFGNTISVEASVTTKIPDTSALVTIIEPDSSTNTSYINGPYEVQWRNSELSTFISFSTKNDADNTWSAFALSGDNKMGDDDVIVCKSVNGILSVEHLYNEGKEAPVPIKADDLQIGLTDIKINQENGYLKCSCNRQKSMPGNDKYFDVRNKRYYILNAYGSASTARSLSSHGPNKAVSKSTVDLESDVAPGAGGANERLIKAHAVLMIIAWLVLSTTGILFARYYKYILPRVLIKDVQFWFFAHRALMMFVLLVSVIGLLLVLFYKDGEWVTPMANARFVHSILGIVALCLAFVQPIMAYLRPTKDSRARPFFNWGHRLLGIFIYLLSIVAIYLGVDIYFQTNSALGLVIGWTVWIVILPIILEITDLLIRLKLRRTLPSDLDDMKFQDEDDLNRAKSQVRFHEGFKSILLVFHLVLSICLTVGFIVLIEQNGTTV